MKPKEKCPTCNQIRYMTKHHVKDNLGRKTGEIQKMCRDCHDEIEEEYRLYGMLKPGKPKKLSKLLNLTYPSKNLYQPIQPFYASS